VRGARGGEISEMDVFVADLGMAHGDSRTR